MASTLTIKDVDGASQADPLPNPATGSVASLADNNAHLSGRRPSLKPGRVGAGYWRTHGAT